MNMIFHYLRAAWQGARKQWLVSGLNIGGLAISIAACLGIALYLQQELRYDQSHPGAERIYRVTEVISGDGHVENSSSSPYPVLPKLLADHGDMIEASTRIFDFQIPVKSLKLSDGRIFNERRIFYADSGVFELLDIPLLRGDQHALSQGFQIVINEELAQKYFGQEDPIGKEIFLAGQDKFKCIVTGIIGTPGTGHFQPRAMISMATVSTIAPYMMQNWVWNPCWTYIRLKEGVPADQFAALMPGFVEKNYPDFNKHMVAHELQPITDIHLRSRLEFEMSQNSDIKYIYIFLSTAIILMLIAAVNFVNLMSASLLDRTKEAGMRKVAGATKTQLFTQVLTESFAYTFTAFLLGLAFLLLLKPFLWHELGVELRLDILWKPSSLLLLLGSVLGLSVLAGLYPAGVFSSLGVVHIFKGSNALLGQGRWFRRVLVVIQFSMAVLLIIFTIVARQQLEFMRARDIGFDPSNVLTLDVQTTPVQQKKEAFKVALLNHSGIQAVTYMNDVLGIENNNHEFNHEGMDEGEWKYFPALVVDEDFVETFDIPIIAGRDFDAHRAKEDSLSVLPNRAMIEWLGYESPEAAIGKPLKTISGSEKIIGVTENFHFKSMHHPVGPFILDIASKSAGHNVFFTARSAIKVNNLNAETLQHIENTWNQFVSNKPFEYQLLSQDIAAQYQGEEQMSELLTWFSVVAILVACMGLFALTWFVARSKVREIAVRRVFGAETPSLMLVATKEQLILVFLSFTLAYPSAYLLLNSWLTSFAYRVSQGLGVYLLAGMMALIIAGATMSFLAYRAAQRSPARTLKYE